VRCRRAAACRGVFVTRDGFELVQAVVRAAGGRCGARDLLSHANSNGDLAVVVERALDELISRLEKRRFGRTPPRKRAPEQTAVGIVSVGEVPVSAPSAMDHPPGGLRRKHIAHEARREVLDRDGVRCAFVRGDGQRCEGRAFLQFHHRRAWERGGSDTAGNLELLCHGHNRLLAERDFGRAAIDAAIAARKVEKLKRGLPKLR
jgi:hypothetical protein